jgi:hypothetical protein
MSKTCSSHEWGKLNIKFQTENIIAREELGDVSKNRILK